MKKESVKKKGSIYELDEIPPLTETIPLGIQHVLAMFAGNITPIIIIAGIFPKVGAVSYWYNVAECSWWGCTYDVCYDSY